jgi:ABC-type uncharacterized transport system substrate-binding protein
MHLKPALALALVAAALGFGLADPALGHPHGTMQCALRVAYENGQPAGLQARLTLDAPHSAEMTAMLRDPATGQLDAARQQRLLFSLKAQLARHNWLLQAQRGEQVADLTQRDEPRLLFAPDGRLAVELALNVGAVENKRAQDGASEGGWQFSCADPSLYWVAEFEPTQAPVTVAGCANARVSASSKMLTGASAGSARAEVRCHP